MDLHLQAKQFNSYLALGLSGKSAWWRYLLGFIIIVGMAGIGVVISAIVLLVVSNGKLLHVPYPQEAAGWRAVGLDPMCDYAINNAPLVLLIPLVWFVVRVLLGRSLLSLITPEEDLDWRRISFGMCVWGCLCVLLCLGTYCWDSNHFEFSLSSELWKWAPAVLLVTPLQCLAEELFFRGYVMQAVGAITKTSWAPVAVSTVLFASLHFLNPEMSNGPVWVNALAYFVVGALLSVVTVQTRSLEMAIGCHIANNLFCALIVNAGDHSAFLTPSVFLYTGTMEPPDVILQILASLVFCVLATRYVRRHTLSEGLCDSEANLNGPGVSPSAPIS